MNEKKKKRKQGENEYTDDGICSNSEDEEINNLSLEGKEPNSLPTEKDENKKIKEIIS